MPTVNIKIQGHLYDLLRNSDYKKQETGDKFLTVSNASFPDGEVFRNVGWDYFVFENCDFSSDMHLYRLNHINFKNCSFKNLFFQAYDWIDVQFEGCQFRDKTYLASGVSSKNVVFDSCSFKSDAENWNDIGGVSIHDVVFKNCQVNNFSLGALQKGIFQNCKFKKVDCEGGRRQSGEIKGYAAEYLIEDCEFTGFIDFRSGIYSSFTMRRTHFDLTSFAQAEIQGQFLLENVKGGYLDTGFGKGNSIVIRDSEFSGYTVQGIQQCLAIYGGDRTIKEVTIENVKCAKDDTNSQYSKGVIIGGGTQSLTIKNFETPICRIVPEGTAQTLVDGVKGDVVSFNDSENVGAASIKNINATDVNFSGIKAKSIDLEEVQCQTAEFNGSEIGTLRFVKNVYVGKKIDFTKAKLGAVDFGGIAVENGNRFGVGATKAVTTGSNLEVVKGHLQLKK
jgi:uncharacterized protein YjbI with pentapeptide repeats